MSIVTELPLWFILFCLLLGLSVAFLLYYKDNKNDFSKRQVYLLAGIRFLTVSLIAFLLLSPLLKTTTRQVEKPLIIIAQDESSSITLHKDSSLMKNAFAPELRTLMSGLSKSFDVMGYSFGERLRNDVEFVFSDKSTDMSSLIEDLRTRYVNRNVGALVISSDGLYNRGSNPLHAAEKLNFPIYTIALGDTTARVDLLISKVNYNKTAFLGNKFPLEIQLRANLLQGKSAVLEVVKDNNVLHSQSIPITANRFTGTIQLSLDASRSGLQHYVIRLKPQEGEITYSNNDKDVFIRVLEGKEKVLILYASPHPDIAAIRSGIESNANYEVSISPINEFNEKLNPYNLVIFHQLPALGQLVPPQISTAMELGIPMLLVLGSQSNLAAFNSLKTGMMIQQEKNNFTESQPSLNPAFVLFNLSEDNKKAIQDYPPLTTPFGNIITLNAVSVMFNQRINNLNTDRPLVLFGQEPNRKYGIIAGEGIWRWKLANYAKMNNHDAFNDLITKIVQYLSIRVNKERFRVFTDLQYIENESVIITAELYNPSYELINDPEVEIVLTNEENERFPFVFSRNSNAYQLNAGMLAAGIYRYQAQCRVGESILRATGEFTVAPLQLESVNTRADHLLLFNLADQHDGKMVYPGQLAALEKLIAAREDIRKVAYTHKRYTDWINLPWVLALILLLLSAEWFIRKRAGSY